MASLDQPLSAGTTRAPTRGWSEYTQLSRQVKHAGLLERRHGWYVAKIALNLVLLAAGGIAFLRPGCVLVAAGHRGVSGGGGDPAGLCRP